MADEPQGPGAAAGPPTAERAAKEVVSGAGIRFEDYVTDWFASYDAALSGDYDAARLVSDATRMTSRLFRDTAKLLFSGFRAAQILADRVAAPTPGGGRTSGTTVETARPANAGPSTPATPS
jgi:hypothetical protein